LAQECDKVIESIRVRQRKGASAGIFGGSCALEFVAELVGVTGDDRVRILSKMPAARDVAKASSANFGREVVVRKLIAQSLNRS
jgi:L-lactate utilization protein LutC